MIAGLLVAIADRDGEHVVAPLHARFHLLQRLTPILQALQLTLRGDDGFNELALGCVLELEIQAFHRRVVRRQFLTQFQVKDGVPGEALQVIEDHHAVFALASLQEPEHGNHAGAFHEVTAAGDVVMEYGFDPIADDVFALERRCTHLSKAALAQLVTHKRQRAQPVGLRRMAAVAISQAQRTQRIRQIIH